MEPNLRARLRAGDPDAFGVLFDQYAHAVYSLGFRLTASWSAAALAGRIRARAVPQGPGR